ncbi:MAG: glycosyl transferase family 2 [Gemmatimonadetes bacterium]|nr:glycosyl transferase family 2 [Gemmatimonadota bacterium]
MNWSVSTGNGRCVSIAKPPAPSKENDVNADEISVVVPAFNAALFVTRTLDTVASQTVRPREVIVADDGSTDDTVQVIEHWALEHPQLVVRVLRCPHRGPGAARNAAIREATGAWIAFLDSDDLWRPEKVERVTAFLSSNPTLNFVCHGEEHLRLDGTADSVDYSELYDPKQRLAPQLFRHNLFSTSAVVCSRQLLLTAGLFDETLMSAQDYEMWLRVAPSIHVGFISAALGTYVERVGNITRGSIAQRRRNHLAILKRYRAYVGAPLYWRAALVVRASAAKQYLRRSFG